MNLTDLKDIMEVKASFLSGISWRHWLFKYTRFSISQKVIVEQMDHKCIDVDVEYFKSVPSTAENIAIFIWDEVTKLLPGNKLYEVRIDETGKNSAFYRGEENWETNDI